MSSGTLRDGGLGLEAWEIRETQRLVMGSTYVMSLAAASAVPSIGPHWVVLAYAVGGAAALGALRANPAREAGSRLRRVLARTCEWSLRMFAGLAMIGAAFMWCSGLVFEPVLLSMTGLWDPEMTKTEVAAAVKEAVRGALARGEPWALAMGVSSVAVGLLSGVADWLWLGAVGERLGVRPWRVLVGRDAWRDWREVERRERARCRRLLRGEP